MFDLGVLILVLVEHTLRVPDFVAKAAEVAVLILVLVEHTLRDTQRSCIRLCG